MLLSIARVPSRNSGQNVAPAVGEPVADRHGNIGAVIGRPAAPRMILSVHSRGIGEATGASPSEGGLMRTRSQDEPKSRSAPAFELQARNCRTNLRATDDGPVTPVNLLRSERAGEIEHFPMVGAKQTVL
jgi:hypothetical protein